MNPFYRGNIEDFNNPVFKNLRILIPQTLNMNIADTMIQAKGDLFLNGPIKTPEIIGQFGIVNLFNQGAQLSISNCNVDFNKNVANLNAPLVKIGDSSVGVNAVFLTDIADKLTVKNINIKHLPANSRQDCHIFAVLLYLRALRMLHLFL